MNPLCPKVRAYLRPAALVAAVLLSPQYLFAWSSNGHKIVGQIAQDLLSRDSEGQAVLADIKALMGPGFGPNGLANLAPCADEIRSLNEETGVTRTPGQVSCGGLQLAIEPQSEPWHFINSPIGSGGSWQSNCPGNNCVVGQIINDVQTLQGSAAAADKQVALMFLVHFVGDVHQPLHCAFSTLATGENDRGGNCEQVSSGGQRLSWHAYWDRQLNVTMPTDYQSEAQSLEGSASIDPGTDPEAIAAQSAKESLDAANTMYADFRDLPNSDKQGCKIEKTAPAVPLPSNYQSANQNIVNERLATAGGRLAALLKIAFGSSQSAAPSAPSAPSSGGKPTRRHRTTDAAPAAALDSSPNAAGVENALQQQ